MHWIAGRAFAKINLGLRILDRRSDGFHELRTVFQTISLADNLRIGWAPGASRGLPREVRLHCDRADLAGPDNLASRAAASFLERAKLSGRVEIELDKRIPAGAGLGGGSSDAAATLWGLSRLTAHPLAAGQLRGIAAEIGSDVPFFLGGGRAAGVGRGERITPLRDLPRRWFLVLAPRLHVSTSQAYAELAQARQGGLTPVAKRRIMTVFSSGIRASGVRGASSPAEAWINDFETVIFRRFPELAQLKARLEKAGARASLLSGSGSALFGLFDSRVAAERARVGFRRFEGDAFTVSTVGRRACAAVWDLLKARDVLAAGS